MSFLIKGMKMPKDCENCPMLDDNGDYPTCILTWTSQGYNWSPIGHRMRNCPIVEVPIPHGRLIDASVAYDCIAEEDHAGNYVDMDAVGNGLDETPTIIEAEDGEP